MKQILLLSTSATLAASQFTQLLNLRNHHLLNNQDKITKLESITLIETFDEVPVFGGEEFRLKMLEKSK